jgi:hypothetical protein
LIGAACFAAGTPDPVDSCQRCDPSARADGWTANDDADVPGMRCQVNRVAGSLVGVSCKDRPMRLLVSAIGMIDHLLDRRAAILQGRVAGVDRRLGRQVARLARAQKRAANAGCAVTGVGNEVSALVAQFHAFKQAETAARGGRGSR